MKPERHRVYGENVDINTENTKAFYDRRALAIARMQNAYTAVLLGDQDPAHAEKWNAFEKEHILPLLNINDHSSVLDIGCGIGRWAESIIPRCCYYYGADFSSEMIKIAKERNNVTGRHYDFVVSSFQEVVNTPVDNFPRKFDRLIVAGVCMYINDTDLEQCFEKILNIMDTHAIVYLTETVAIQKRLTLDAFYSSALKTNYDVIYRTPDEYSMYYKFLTESGFTITRQTFLPRYNEEQEYRETDRWYTILER